VDIRDVTLAAKYFGQSFNIADENTVVWASQDGAMIVTWKDINLFVTLEEDGVTPTAQQTIDIRDICLVAHNFGKRE
jgi:hypothetical protein